jgi:hypothetical protein
MPPGSVFGAASSSAAAKASAQTTTDGDADVDLVVLAYVAGRQVPVREEELNSAVRRALLVFAAGGDLHREPALDDPAVLELARDLDSDVRRAALAAGVEALDADPATLSRLRDPEVAWRAYACGLLAEALGEEETADADEI